MRILILLPFIYIAGVLETSLGDVLQVGYVGPDWMGLLAIGWDSSIESPQVGVINSPTMLSKYKDCAICFFSPAWLRGPFFSLYCPESAIYRFIDLVNHRSGNEQGSQRQRTEREYNLPDEIVIISLLKILDMVWI